MKFLGVEAARGVASLLVVIVHASAMLADPKDYGVLPFGGLFRFGHAGVDFFFVLSGFIITYVHANEVGARHRLPAYVWKRFARIYPTYWIVTAILGAILIFSPTHERTEQQLATILTSVFLLPTIETPILGVAWSLKHEILFYGLFSLLFLDRRLGVSALAIWGTLISFNIFMSWTTGTPYFSGIAGDLIFRIFNIEFFFGIFVAILVVRRSLPYPRLALAAGTVLFFGNGVLESWGPDYPIEWPPRHLAYATGSALALYGLVGAEAAQKIRIPKALLALGTASYSLYLLHVIVIMIAQQAARLLPHVMPMQAELTFLIFVGAAIASALAFCRLVEQPLLRIFRKLPAIFAPRLETPR